MKSDLIASSCLFALACSSAPSEMNDASLSDAPFADASVADASIGNDARAPGNDASPPDAVVDTSVSSDTPLLRDSNAPVDAVTPVGDTGAVRRCSVPTTGMQFHVTTTGRATGDGSLANPWPFGAAVHGDVTIPAGATVWIHGGEYVGEYSVGVAGTSSAPIVFRAVPGERASLVSSGTGPYVIYGLPWSHDVWFWGLEIAGRPATRVCETTTNPPGIGWGSSSVGATPQPGFKLINSVIHDTGQGISAWGSAIDAEVYGNLVYQNGCEGSDRGHGHGIYTQNLTGRKRFEENIVWGGYGYGTHQYTENGNVENMTWIGNVSFNTGTAGPGPRAGGRDYYHGSRPVSGLVFNDNFHWARERGSVLSRLGDNDTVGVTIERNIFMSDLEIHGPITGTISVSANRVFGTVMNMGWAGVPGFTEHSSLPTTNEIYVRSNRHEANRSHIIVYNYEDLATVSVNFDGLIPAGTRYEVRSVQNYYGPLVTSGVYTGGSIRIPMGTPVTQPHAEPSGYTTAEQTGRAFDVFVMTTECPVGT